MKKYTQTISKLYEAVGYERIEEGKTYVTSKGDKVEVKDIFIDATNEIPEVYVDYAFEMKDGKSGSETNRYTVLVDMLRNM
jgi:hypothetical protein